MVTIKSGGGYNSRQVSHRYEPKVEPKAKAGNVAGVAQQGLATAFRKSPIEQGKGYEPGPQRETGIAQAKYNPATSGPGSLRTTYRSGSQSPTPTATPMRAGRNTMGEYGPELSGRPPGWRR